VSVATPVLRARSLAVGYRLGGGRELRLLDGAELELPAGELVSLLGPNGSGKSTLLRTIAGMQRPLAGTVQLMGQDIGSATAQWLARHVSVVLTEPIDVGALTARELVGLGRYPYTDWLGRLTRQDSERVAAALAAVDARRLAEQPVRTLSDGERQRVLIARALAQDPELMILDEPTAFLDLPRRIETLGLLRRLVRETGVTVLLSTHQLELALLHSDRVWLLPLGGPIESGAPEDVALSGGLERTFRSERLRFDSAEGSFRLREESRGGERVSVEGDGLPRRWTEKALVRGGFVPVALEAAPPAAAPAPFARVRIVDELALLGSAHDAGVAGPVESASPAAVRFELEVADERVVYATLYDLLRRLERYRAAARR
jgi:iron complex transport system ATP-binding protein